MPELKTGSVLVKVEASLVSPGTELGGWCAFAAQKQTPAPKKEHTFGYSNAGIVLATAGEVEFRPGDRVACIGAGFALHSDYAVVPHHSACRCPKLSPLSRRLCNVVRDRMQALRRGQPEFWRIRLHCGSWFGGTAHCPALSACRK
jgi:threonine dehydrogenase-like Zn-dependent dehydrogenase